jgi:hypothetical protein
MVADEERDLLPPSYDEALRLLVRLKEEESAEAFGTSSPVEAIPLQEIECRAPLLPDGPSSVTVHFSDSNA